MRKLALTMFIALQVPALAWASPNPKLVIPEFAGLAQKATDSVTITLDPALLSMASRFLDASDPQDAATQLESAGADSQSKDACGCRHLYHGRQQSSRWLGLDRQRAAAIYYR
jgi:hypothetical protein